MLTVVLYGVTVLCKNHGTNTVSYNNCGSTALLNSQYNSVAKALSACIKG